MQSTQKAQRVLIVEEDRVEAGIVAFHLRRAGYKPLLVSSGDEAKDAVAWGTPDAVVAELNGPGVNGLEFAASLAGKSLVFVLVADRALTGDEELSALRLRLHHVIQKPIDPDGLVDHLRRDAPHVLGPAESDSADSTTIRGSLADRSTVSLVRMASRHRIDCVLEVTSEGPDGWLVMRQGQIIDAALGDSVAKAAAIDMLLRERGQFALRPLGLNDPDLQRLNSVQCDLAQLVAEAMAKASTASIEPDQGSAVSAQAASPTESTKPTSSAVSAAPRPRDAKSRQVGIPATTTPPTLPDADRPIPREAPTEQVATTPQDEHGRDPKRASAAPDNLPWWKPPPLKGFQPPKAATARRRGNRIQVNTRPRVRDGETTTVPVAEGRSVRAQRTTGSQAAALQRKSAPPARPATRPQGMPAADPITDNASERPPRKITQPGMQATDPSQALLDELGPPNSSSERLASKRRSAGPVISKGTPQVLPGPPRARLKPPPFKRPSPPGPPPSEDVDSAQAPGHRRRGPRRFQTAGRMKAIEPSADLAAAYQEFKEEYGLGGDQAAEAAAEAARPTPSSAVAQDDNRGQSAPPTAAEAASSEHSGAARSAQHSTKPPLPPAEAPPSAGPPPSMAATSGPSEAQQLSGQSTADDAEATERSVPDHRSQPSAATESADASNSADSPEPSPEPAPEATANETTAGTADGVEAVDPPESSAPQVAEEPAIAEGAPSEDAPVGLETAPALTAQVTATGTQEAGTPAPVASSDSASQDQIPPGGASNDGDVASNPPTEAPVSAEEEKVRGRLVPRTFFEDGERPVRKLRRTSHPDLQAATAGDEDQSASADAATATRAQTRTTNPPGRVAPSPEEAAPTAQPGRASPEQPPEAAGEPNPPADDWPEPLSDDAPLESFGVETDIDPHGDEPSIAFSGLAAAPPVDAPRRPNFKAINIALGLVLLAAIAFVVYGMATRQRGNAPKPGVSAAGGAAASESFEARLGKATLALESDKLDEAQPLFKALAGEKPGDPTVVSGWAMAAYGKRDWAEAKVAFEKLRELKPQEPQVYYHLIYVYAALKQNGAAREAAATFNRLAPPDSPEAKTIQSALEKAETP